MGSNGHRTDTIPGVAIDLPVYSWGDLLLHDFPVQLDLVERIIQQGTGNIIAGPPSVGKTWLVLSLARSIASGTDWLGHFPTTQATVLMIDEESHVPGLQSRARMLEEGNPLGQDLPLYFAVGHGVRFDANPGAAHLDALIDRFKPKFVIVDSLTRVHGADENSAGQMSDVFGNAKALMRRHETAILFTDHVRKKGLMNDAEEMLRGSTEKRAWPECILFAAPGENRRITVSHVKARYTERLEDFDVDVRVDRDAGSAEVVYAGAATASADSKPHEIIQAIHALKAQLGENGADATTVSAYLGCSDDTVRRHMKKLIPAGLVDIRKVRDTGGRPKDAYDVTGGRD